MRTIVAWLLLPGVLSLAACFPAAQNLRGERTDQLDHWVAEEEYGKALKRIDRVSPKDPAYPSLQERRAEILRLADKYEQALVKEARKLKRSEKWQEAFDLYEQGLSKLPNSERIQKARDEFLTERATRVEALRVEALISKGDWLNRDFRLRKKTVAIVPEDRRARKDLKRTTRELEETSKQLYVCGQRAWERGDNELALRCLSLAEKLRPTSSVKDALVRVKKEQSKRKAKKRRATRKKKEKSDADMARKFLDEYEEAFEQGDLLRAREALAKSKSLQPSNERVEQLEKELELSIANRVKRGMEESRRVYSQGKIQQALDNWRYLSKLDPDNEDIKVHIARAERVLAKVRELSEKQSPASSLKGSSAE